MHLLSVWNPAYADEALNAHASLLRSVVREALAKDDWDRAFVWWGPLEPAAAAVAEVAAISAENPDVTDPIHTPAYYVRNQLTCDCWFMLVDIRRLVADNLMGVIDE